MPTPANETAKQVMKSTGDLRERLRREIDSALCDFRRDTGLSVESVRVELKFTQKIRDIDITITG